MSNGLQYFNEWAIPQELKLLANWILWDKREAKDKNRFKKCPLSLDGLPWDLKTTWTFSEALLAAKSQGLGVAFSLADTPYCVLDLDAPSDAANNLLHGYILAEFRETYLEISPSGTGYHIVINDPTCTTLFAESRLDLSCLCKSDKWPQWIILTGRDPYSWLRGEGVDKPIQPRKVWDSPIMQEIKQVVERLQFQDEEYEEMMAERNNPYGW